MTHTPQTQPAVPEPHVPAKPLRWLWEVRRYLNRHQTGDFLSGNQFFVVSRLGQLPPEWSRSEIIKAFNEARKGGGNQ